MCIHQRWTVVYILGLFTGLSLILLSAILRTNHCTLYHLQLRKRNSASYLPLDLEKAHTTFGNVVLTILSSNLEACLFMGIPVKRGQCS